MIHLKKRLYRIIMKILIGRKVKVIGIISVFFIFAALWVYCKNSFSAPNVIIIVVDALRSDHLGCYGYRRNTSPNVDRLAKEGVMFKQAITAAGWTWESVPSILTGVYSPVHHIKDWNKIPLNPAIKTLPRILKQRNIHSVLFSDTLALGMLDIKDGFDSVFIEGGSLNMAKVADWLKGNAGSPFFMYIHFLGSHAPYGVSRGYYSNYLSDEVRIRKEIPIVKKNELVSQNGHREFQGLGKIPYLVAQKRISDTGYYVAKYDGAINFTDNSIGDLLKSLKLSGLLNNTMIIITADHGESLGEHNIYFDHANCYEEDIRVPLIIIFPKLFSRGEVISQQVSLVDIVPTVLDIMRIKIPSYVQGKSLMRLLKNKKNNLHPYVYISAPGYDGLQSAIRSEDWKLIKIDNSYELYNLSSDPQEKFNLINKEEARFEEYKRILEFYHGNKYVSYAEGKVRFLTDQEKMALKTLGYLQ